MKPHCENPHHFALFVLATTERAPPIPLASIPYRCHIVTFDRAQPPRECALIVAISHLSGIWPKFYSPKHLSVKSPWWTRQLVIFFPQFFFLVGMYCFWLSPIISAASVPRQTVSPHRRGSVWMSWGVVRRVLFPFRLFWGPLFPPSRLCSLLMAGRVMLSLGESLLRLTGDGKLCIAVL